MLVKVLIVEDNPITARDLYEVLQEKGYNPKVAYSAHQAISMLESFSPDLLLVDIQLKKGKTGIELIKEVGGELSIPFIYLTASSRGQVIEEAMATLPSAFLKKPFDQRDVVKAINSALSK